MQSKLPGEKGYAYDFAKSLMERLGQTPPERRIGMTSEGEPFERETVFLGGKVSGPKGEWRSPVKDELRDEGYDAIDPKKKNWDPTKDIYKEVEQMLTADHVVFLAGGGPFSKREMKLLDAVGKDYEVVKKPEEVLDVVKAAHDPYEAYLATKQAMVVPMPHVIAEHGLQTMNAAGHDLSALAQAHTNAKGFMETAKRVGVGTPQTVAGADKVIDTAHRAMAGRVIQQGQAQQRAVNAAPGYSVNPLGHPAISPERLAPHVTERILAKSGAFDAFEVYMAVKEAAEHEPDPRHEQGKEMSAMIMGAGAGMVHHKVNPLGHVARAGVAGAFSGHAHEALDEDDVRRLVKHFEGRTSAPVKLHHVSNATGGHMVHGDDLRRIRALGVETGLPKAYDNDHVHVAANLHRAPAVLAHELGHATEGQTFRRAGLVSRNLSNLGTPLAAAGNDYVTGAVVASSLPALAQEGRASYLGYHAIKQTMGEAAARKSVVPLAAAFGSYAASMVGKPLATHFISKKVQQVVRDHDKA